jgi:predicted nucleic acid-binding protein
MSKARARQQRRQQFDYVRAMEARRPIAHPNMPRVIMPESKDPADWGPNERLASKIMQPPIDYMLARGSITREQHDAALDIERVVAWVTAGLAPKTVDWGRVRGKGIGTSDPMSDAYTARYRRWADELRPAHEGPPDLAEIARVYRSANDNDIIIAAARAERRTAKRQGEYHPKTLEFVIALVVEGHTIERIAKISRHSPNTVRDAIKRGLTRYAEIAGWVRRPRTAA